MAFRRISYHHYFENLQLLLTSKSDNPIESVSNAHVTELVSSTANYRTDGPWREPTRTSALPQLNRATESQSQRQAPVAIGDRNNERARLGRDWPPQQWDAELSRQMASSRLKGIYYLHYLLSSSVASCPRSLIVEEILMFSLSVTSVLTLLKTVYFEKRT